MYVHVTTTKENRGQEFERQKGVECIREGLDWQAKGEM